MRIGSTTHPMRRLVALLVVALGATLLVSTIASAQEERMVIVVDEEVRAVGEQYHGGYLDVHVDGVLCGRWSMTEANRLPDGGSEFELGRDDQPEECGREGGTIRFSDGNGTVLSHDFTVERGATVTLSWLQAGAIRFEPTPTTDGRTLLTLSSDFRESGERRESAQLNVYADGQYCGPLSFLMPDVQMPDGGIALVLAQDDQPEACGRDGAVISLVNGLGQQLSATYRLDVGWQIPVQNFTIPPPHTGGNGESAPGAPEVGTGLAGGSGDGTGLAIRVGAMAVLLAALTLFVRVLRPGDRTG